jgi:hypothetical protein
MRMLKLRKCPAFSHTRSMKKIKLGFKPRRSVFRVHAFLATII